MNWLLIDDNCQLLAGELEIQLIGDFLQRNTSVLGLSMLAENMVDGRSHAHIEL